MNKSKVESNIKQFKQIKTKNNKIVHKNLLKEDHGNMVLIIKVLLRRNPINTSLLNLNKLFKIWNIKKERLLLSKQAKEIHLGKSVEEKRVKHYLTFNHLNSKK